MEAIISNLLSRFEKGALSRRELVQGLAALAAVGGAGSAAEAQGAAALHGAKIDHVSIQVPDLQRSIEFYQTIFGFTILGQDKPNEIVRMGSGKILVSLHHKDPTGIVDHFAIGVENFNRQAVTEALKSHGVTPEENLDAGFHVKDPAGISVQIMGA
ncbi:MAG TPA: VOC family protein [Bryobacteraceae bacterium]|nr:VOC family protein [Bryobacteraceae bacterium]